MSESIAHKIRQALLTQVGAISRLHGEMAATYLGWYQESVLSGAHPDAIVELERRFSEALPRHRFRIREAVNEAVRVASESASELAGDDFHSETTQHARRDLERHTSDEIQRRVAAQLQSDQATLINRRQLQRVQQLSEQGMRLGVEMSKDIEDLLMRPDSIGRRRKSTEYVQVEVSRALFNLTNWLTYSLLMANGQTQCTLDHALRGTELMALSQFIAVERDLMHPRSTLLIERVQSA